MTLSKKLLICLTVVTLTLPTCVQCSNILFLTPLGTKSHKNVFEPLIRALGAGGHKLTVIANVASSDLGPNVTEFVPTDLQAFLGTFPDPFKQREKGYLSSFWDFSFVYNVCNKVHAIPEFQKLMSQKYDLVIVNGFMHSCFLGYLTRIQAPFIYIVSMAAPNTLTQRVGNWLPTSFVPNPFFPLSDKMNFVQRSINLLLDWVTMSQRDSSDECEKIYRKHLKDDTLPSVGEIDRNVSLILMNSYLSFPAPRPTLPDVVEVGGMHCRPAKPLPKDLDDFLSGAKDGFIFFSMGSVVKSNTMPESVRKMFINVFSRLKQRVLWKWDEEMDDLPPNVKIGKWLPQQDILGHPNIRLFITHGGLLSTQESIYHGVPLLGIPMFIDQDLNMNQAEAAGFALTLEILGVTEEKIENVLHRALLDPTILERAKYLSRAFKDQMQTPVERAVYWVEYVIRHKGAHHLRSAARQLNFIEYHSIDVIAFIFSIFLVILTVIAFTLRKMYSFIKRLFHRTRASSISSTSKSKSKSSSSKTAKLKNKTM